MSDTSGFTEAYNQATEAFTKFVPGFEFLQGLVKNAGKALPSMGQWVAPTLDPDELERRIDELRTVQFWLEQNARMIGTTIQALEVQRMTLGTLKGMNVSLADLGEALKVRVPDMFGAGMAAAQAESSARAQKPARSEPAATPATPESDAEPAGNGAAAAGAIDPMQWWGSLTQQFTQLAAQAIQATSDAARQASQVTSDAATQASEAVKAATAAAAQAAQPMAQALNEASEAASRARSTAAPAKGKSAAHEGKAGTGAAGKGASKASASAGGQSDDADGEARPAAQAPRAKPARKTAKAAASGAAAPRRRAT